MASNQDNSEQMAVNDKLEQMYVSELIEELEQCREDERSSRNQMIAILGAVATFIAAVVGVAQIKEVQEGWAQNNLFINGFSTLVLCVAIPYLANLGLLSCFRHHYINDIENELDEIVSNHEKRKFFHWESISTPLITFNYKNILPGYSSIYSINMGICLASILLLAAIYILFIQTLSPKIVLATIGSFVFSVGFWTVALISAFTMIIASRCSKEIYEQAKKQAGERKINPKALQVINKDIYKSILYLVYPRPTDIQKNIFFVIGILFSAIVNYRVGKPNSIEVTVAHLIFCWLVFDFLIYQARYQLNDLEGIDNDKSHPGKDLRKRLPINDKNDKEKRRTAKLSISVASFKLVCAFAMLFVYIRLSTWRRVAAIGCLFLIVLIAFVYEDAKRKDNHRLVLFLVSLGYPIRVFAGMLCEIDRLNTIVGKNTLVSIIMILLLLGTAACGEFFVTLMWAQEGVYLTKEDPNRATKMFAFLFSKDSKIKERYTEQQPLLYEDSLFSIWNVSLFLTYAFIGAAYIVCGSMINIEVAVLSIVFILAMLFITYSCGTGVFGKSMLKAALLLLGISIASILFSLYLFGTGRSGYSSMLVLLYAVLCFYSILYCSFRLSNYESLISFLPQLLSKMVTLMYKAGEVLLGEELMKLISRKKE